MDCSCRPALCTHLGAGEPGGWSLVLTSPMHSLLGENLGLRGGSGTGERQGLAAGAMGTLPIPAPAQQLLGAELVLRARLPTEPSNQRSCPSSLGAGSGERRSVSPNKEVRVRQRCPV